MEAFAARSENVMVCKSMSKVYALSGLRVAYLCGGSEQLEGLRAITPPWVIGLPAQVAATLALRDEAYYRARYKETDVLREGLAGALAEMGWVSTPGCANFLLCELPKEGLPAREAVARCQRMNLYLRDASSMGRALSDRTIRMAVKDAETNERMIEIVRELKA